jgi:hypothetical protein
VGGYTATESLVTSRIETQIKSELPKASKVKASISLVDIVHSLFSDSLKSANFTIDDYALSGSVRKSSIAIFAKNISKSKPTFVGSLEVIATIPAATILQSAEFSDAQIINDTLQVSAGVGGLGKAILVPKFSMNEIYFELKGVSIFGNEVPASALPADVQDQIKNRSVRSINVPQGMNLTSVKLKTEGLVVTVRGVNIQIHKLKNL